MTKLREILISHFRDSHNHSQLKENERQMNEPFISSLGCIADYGVKCFLEKHKTTKQRVITVASRPFHLLRKLIFNGQP